MIRCELLWSLPLPFCNGPPRDQIIISIGSSMTCLCEVFVVVSVDGYCFFVDLAMAIITGHANYALFPYKVFFSQTTLAAAENINPSIFSVQRFFFSLWLVSQSRITEVAGRV